MFYCVPMIAEGLREEKAGKTWSRYLRSSGSVERDRSVDGQCDASVPRSEEAHSSLRKQGGVEERMAVRADFILCRIFL